MQPEFAIPASQFAEVLVTAPHPDGPFESMLDDVDEAGVGDALPHGFEDEQRFSRAAGTFDAELGPALEGAASLEGVVVGVGDEADLGLFDVATGDHVTMIIKKGEK